MQKTLWFSVICFIFLLSCSKVGDSKRNSNTDNNNPTESDLEDPVIGEILPDWEEGYLDIHAINTGRGESALLIFPDGTTMLVDAAGSLISPSDPIPPPPQKPNSNVSSGLAISNYVNHFIKSASNKLNYIMVSHFHGDHMGEYGTNLPMDPTQTFRVGGMMEVGVKVPFDKIIDRGYPDYNFPTDMTRNPTVANYTKFVDWAETSNNTEIEQFDVGKNDQIVLTENPSKYSNFEIRNICSNGVVWKGVGTETINTLPSASEINASGSSSENIFSLGFVLSYGKFDYFSAGDLQYSGRSTYSWKDIEEPVANVVPAVDVMKANHHGTSNCNGTAILNSLSPRAVIIHNWRDIQPNPETISRMFAVNNNCQIFSTNMTTANRQRLGSDFNRLKSTQGHVVVRVSPGGDEYYIYVLDDSNQDYIVTQVFGPYKSE